MAHLQAPLLVEIEVECNECTGNHIFLDRPAILLSFLCRQSAASQHRR
jgi:hypothetical protein